jgi:type IV pilus assembly protein PilM
MLTRLFGPAPLVGIDVGSHSIKVVESRISRNGKVQVTGMATVATPPDSFRDGQVQDAAALGRAIREALGAGSIRSRRAAVAVPAQFGFARRLQFPRMPLRELRQTIALQPERYIPLAAGAVFDLYVLPASANQEQLSVVVAAAPRQQVLDLMQACKVAGLRPVRVDLEPLALHRSLVVSGLATEEMVVGIVDLGATSAKISLFEGPVPVVSRVVDIARPDLPDGMGFLPGLQAEELFLDIRRSLEFALTQTAAAPSRIFIGGGAGADAYLLASLTAYLRGFLSHRLPGDFVVMPIHAPDFGLSPDSMLAFGLSISPELFA